MGRDIIAC